jgi:uncharacterized protein (DUF4415 family)
MGNLGGDRLPEPVRPVNIRLDAAVLRWFEAGGAGCQTRVNPVPRAFVRARERAEGSRSNMK